MAKTKISQFDATAANNTDLNSISVAEGTAPSNINNAIRELMSQLADLNLGNEVLSTLKIDNLHLDGNTIITLDTNGDLNLTPNGTGAVTIAKADINGGTIDGTPIGGASRSTGAFSTLSANSTVGLGSSVTISGGNIDGVIGANTPAVITGTVITANTNFAGNLTGNVTGTVDGVVGGSTPAAITGTTITANTKFVGAIDGNVTATSGTSQFNNVTINGTLDMNSTTSQTITGLASPSGSTDAATKGYVDTEVSGLVDSAPAALNTLNELAAALGDDASFSTTITNSIAAKLPLAGGTMTGDINANSNTVSGLKAPSNNNDATTKTYVDTADALKLNLGGGTLSGNLVMGNNKVTGLAAPTADNDAARKKYVDDIAGSGTAAATSASAAASSATASASSATASANSATASASSATSAAASLDSFDDRYLGAKSSAPTVDNDGDALVTGALYWNTSSNDLYVWNGSAWEQGAFSSSGVLSNVVEDTTPQLSGDLDAQGKDIEDVGIVSADGIAGIYGASGSPVTYTVTVASKTAAHPYNGDGSSSAYFLNGIESPALQLQGVDGTTANTEYFYKFDQSHSSNSGHPLRFYKDAAKSQAYTAGVTTNGTAGNSGAFTTIAVDDATLNVLYYECSSHAYMGNYVTTPATSVQGLDAEITAIAGLTSAADKGIQFTGDGTAGVYDLTTAGKALLDDADAAAQRTTLGLGTVATTAATAYATSAQGTKADNAAAKASNLSDLASASTARTNLGLGTASTLTAGTSANNAVQLDGSAKLPAVDGSALTNLVAGGVINKVADGAIAIRKPVVLTAAGKAKQVVETVTTDTTSMTLSNGSAGAQQRGTNNVNRLSTIYDTNSDRFVTTYADDGNSGYGTAVVHTLSNASTGAMTYGTPVVFESADTGASSGTKYMAFDSSANRVVIAYRDSGDSNKGKAVVGSVTAGNNSIAFGTPVEFDSGATNFIVTVYHPNVDRTVIFYTDNTDNAYGQAIVGTVTAGNNSIAFGDANNFHAGTTYNKAACYEPDTHKILIAYDDRQGGSTGEGVVATVYGGSNNFIVYGSAAEFNSGEIADISIDYDTTANKFVIGYKNESFNNYSTARVATISGNSVSFGSKVVIETTNGSDRVVLFDPDLEKIMLVYNDATNSKIKLHYIAISGTTPSSFENLEVATTDSAAGALSAAYDTDNNKFVVMFQDSDDDLNAMMINSAYATSTSTNLDNGNYLGVSAAAISDGATGVINVIGGTSTGHSSLTIGTNYFATDAGAIATSGTQLIGKALSATEIQLGVKSGTAAHNTVALDANAKLPAVDGSQLTNLATGEKVFCGSYDFRVDGSSTAQNVLISLPSGHTVANVRAYEINYYGIGFASNGNYFCYKPYNGSSSVVDNGFYNSFYFNKGNDGTHGTDTKTESAAIMLNWISSSYDQFSGNDVDNPKQNYNNDSGWGGQITGQHIYTNSLKNGSSAGGSHWRFSTGGYGYQAHARSTHSRATDNSTDNYADGFFFFVGNSSQAAQSVAIMEGVVSVYAIIG